MKYGLKTRDYDDIVGVFSSYPEVKRVLIYGSRAKGNYKNGSDIDLTIKGDDEITLGTLNKISWQLDDLLLPYSFDLSLYHQITNKELLDHIQRVGVIFYEKNKIKN